MEADSTLIRSYCTVELHPEAAVHANLAAIVNPRNTEFDYSLGLNYHIEHSAFNIFGMFLYYGLEGFKHLINCLVKFIFPCVSVFNIL